MRCERLAGVLGTGTVPPRLRRRVTLREGAGAWPAPTGKSELHLLGRKKGKNLLNSREKLLEVALFEVQLKKKRSGLLLFEKHFYQGLSEAWDTFWKLVGKIPL